MSAQRVNIAVEIESVVMCALLSAETAGPTLRRGAWFSRYEPRKLGFTAWQTSEETRKEFAYVRATREATLLVVKLSTMRSTIEGKKFPRAPWRSRDPTSSSSKRATILS